LCLELKSILPETNKEDTLLRIEQTIQGIRTSRLKVFGERGMKNNSMFW
jgi:hypothetical protein